MRTRLVICLLLGATGLVACGGGGSSPTTSTTTTADPTTSTSTPVVPSGNVDTRSAPRTSDDTTHLNAVRVARQGDSDRITFEFDEAVPGYEIRYTTMPPRQDGSGDTVQVGGGAGIAVRFDGASAVELTGGVTRTYTGPDRISPTDTANIAEVVRVSDYEAQLVWAIGVDRTRPFEVTTLGDPSRVVVDID